jgi:hypothetical protein
MLLQNLVEKWLLDNYSYNVRINPIALDLGSTVISINHYDRVGLEIFYNIGYLSVTWFDNINRTPESVDIYYSDPAMFDRLKCAISYIEEATATVVI